MTERDRVVVEPEEGAHVAWNPPLVGTGRLPQHHAFKWLVVLVLSGSTGCGGPVADERVISVEPPPPGCLGGSGLLSETPKDLARRAVEEYSGTLAPYWSSPHEVVDCMLDLADVGRGDVVIDLGAGDGRIVIAAAGRGARGVGMDYDPQRVAEANANAQIAGVRDRVTFIEGDIRDADLSEATVVTLYLLPESNIELLPKLTRELRPGARIVSHDFDMGSWLPDQTVRLRPHTIYLWHHDGTIRAE